MHVNIHNYLSKQLSTNLVTLFNKRWYWFLNKKHFKDMAIQFDLALSQNVKTLHDVMMFNAMLIPPITLCSSMRWCKWRHVYPTLERIKKTLSTNKGWLVFLYPYHSLSLDLYIHQADFGIYLARSTSCLRTEFTALWSYTGKTILTGAARSSDT